MTHDKIVWGGKATPTPREDALSKETSVFYLLPYSPSRDRLGHQGTGLEGERETEAENTHTHTQKEKETGNPCRDGTTLVYGRTTPWFDGRRIL